MDGWQCFAISRIITVQNAIYSAQWPVLLSGRIDLGS
jgi:hypothetical protein